MDWHRVYKDPPDKAGSFVIPVIDRRICSNNPRRIRLLPQDKSFDIQPMMLWSSFSVMSS